MNGLYLAEMIDGEPRFTNVPSYDDLPAGAIERTKAATTVNGTLYELYVMPAVPTEFYTGGWDAFILETTMRTINASAYMKLHR